MVRYAKDTDVKKRVGRLHEEQDMVRNWQLAISPQGPADNKQLRRGLLRDWMFVSTCAVIPSR